MSFDIGDGILGLEAIHTWDTYVDLNNISGGMPRVKLDKITGLHSLPDAVENGEKRNAGIGDIVYPTMPGGKTIVYEGRLQAATLKSLRAFSNELKYRFADWFNERQMVVAPHEDYGEGFFTYYARVLDLDISEVQSRIPGAMPTAYQRDITLSLRQSNPRYYWHEVETATGVSGGSDVFNNAGKAPTDPIISLAGPINGDVVIERLTANPDTRTLTLLDVVLAGGQHINVDFAQRSILRASDGLDYGGTLSFANSDWWDNDALGLHPGNTTVKVTGAPSWTFTGYPAVW